MAVEREVKLAVWPGFRLPRLDDVIGRPPVVRPSRTLDAIYHDTADLRLARAGITLRHRRDGDEGTWTLKLPVPVTIEGSLARDEIDVPGTPDQVPDGLLAPVAARLRTARVLPVARLRTERTSVRFYDADERLLAEVVDDEVSALDGEHLALRFRELEVELGEAGTEEVLAALVGALRRAGATTADPTPKLFRALGPHALAPEDPAVTELPPDPTAADVVHAGLARSVRRLLDHDPIAREGRDPEGVHQTRVATRRLRSDLRVYAPLLDVEEADALRDELGWLADALGAVRDTDVLGMRLRRQLDGIDAVDWPAALELLDVLRAQREKAVVALAEVLDSTRYIELLDRLVTAVDTIAATPQAAVPAADVLPSLAVAPFHHLRKAVHELGDDPTDEALHRVRIRAKRARYAAEVAALVVGPPAARLADRLGNVQDLLGEHQDACVARAWLHEVALTSCSEMAVVAGQLMEIQREEAAQHRAAFTEVWARAKKGKLRTWLR